MMETGTLAWLLSPDNPSSRYLTFAHLLDRPSHDPEMRAAQAAIPSADPARLILEAQWPEGYWMRPGIGYSPKHKATVWQVLFLAALGAPRTQALELAGLYVLEHSRLPDGRFSAHKKAPEAVACLNGNLLRALLQLGFEDPRLDESIEALAEMVARDAFHCRWNARKPTPARMRDGLPCAWGAIKALGAFAEVPPAQRSPSVQAAIGQGIAFLLEGDLASGGYPTATKPSRLWHWFGFPMGFTSDLVEALEVLGALGAPEHPRLTAALEVVRGRQDSAGRWALEYTPRNTWASFGEVGQPNKWVTLRALRALKKWEQGANYEETR